MVDTTTEANQYTVTGGGLEGVVSTTSFGGQPQASIDVDGTSVEGLTISQTGRGIEVAGVISAVPDDRTVSLLLLVPVVRLEDGAPQPWAGVALVTTARSSIGGPGLLSGPLHVYQVRPVGGLAAAVDFLAGGPGSEYEV